MPLSASSAGWYRLVLTVSERKSKNKVLNTRLPKAEASESQRFHSLPRQAQALSPWGTRGQALLVVSLAVSRRISWCRSEPG